MLQRGIRRIDYRVSIPFCNITLNKTEHFGIDCLFCNDIHEPFLF
jgi:hypothetical protein